MEKIIDKNYKELLNIYTTLYNNNEQKKKSGTHDYSLMNALLKTTDEVNLHSNFIYSMINPNGSHYCGSIFLKIFLESINEDDFIDIKNAKVYKEKGKIDLLVEDGNHVLIIENKLRAVDQEHQFSRYIQYVYDKYMDKNTIINDKIHIVYLSEYKKIPSKESKSILGFDELDDKSTELVWQVDNTALCNGANLSLPKGTRLKYNRVQHSVHLLQWVMESKKYLSDKPNSQSLIYAFDEYKLILERLKDNKWRNIMELDEYTLSLEEDNKQKQMYDFMIEAKKLAYAYAAKKLYREIALLSGETISFNPYTKDRNFDEPNCIKWFNKKGEKKEWRDTGFTFSYNNEKYIFLLGVTHAYVGSCNDTDKGITEDNKIKDARDNIFNIIEKFNRIIQK